MHSKTLRTPLTILALTWALGAFAQNTQSVFIEDLTWTELQAQIQAGKRIVIIPIGGTEQSGPYIALGKHNARVKALSEKIALTLGNALVAPVIAYVPEGTISPPTAHMKFPGTITVPETVFQKTLESAARSFKLHGFRDIVFLGDHGGYQASLKTVADQLNRDWFGTPAKAYAALEYYRVTQTEYVRSLKARGYRDEEIGNHAGLADTSLMLAIDPRLVRKEKLHGELHFEKGDGIDGDPRRATAELGQIGVDAIVAQTVDAIRKAVAQHESASRKTK
ncbi:MAG TPA: creatininase family protein [Burkholderiaceae bacterium]|jgi:creatinine amidohydrolase/Fe(II)-dependent formamide hydrolase-like protein